MTPADLDTWIAELEAQAIKLTRSARRWEAASVTMLGLALGVWVRLFY